MIMVIQTNAKIKESMTNKKGLNRKKIKDRKGLNKEIMKDRKGLHKRK